GSSKILLRGHLGDDGLYQFDSPIQHKFEASAFSPYKPTVHSVCQANNGVCLVPNTSFSVPSPRCNNVESSNTSTDSSPSSNNSSIQYFPSLYIIWHSRLGHPHHEVLKHILKLCNQQLPNKNLSDFCSACCLGKVHRLPSVSSTATYTKPLELVFCDLWGPAPVESFGGYSYFLTCVDAYTRFTWIFPLKLKSHTLSTFQNFKSKVELQYNLPIKVVQTDGGGEFCHFTQFLTPLGIIHRLTCTHTHHQNGSVERKHRHIVENGLTLLAHAKVPLHFWDHAFLTATYLINRLPSPTLDNKSPFFLLNFKIPDYKFLKTFGCACFPFLRPYNTQKMNFHSKECIFLGYSPVYKGYKCLDSTGKIFISKDVMFNKARFPYNELFPSDQPSHQPLSVNSTSPTLSSFPPTPNPVPIPPSSLAAPPHTVAPHTTPIQSLNTPIVSLTPNDSSHNSLTSQIPSTHPSNSVSPSNSSYSPHSNSNLFNSPTPTASGLGNGPVLHPTPITIVPPSSVDTSSVSPASTDASVSPNTPDPPVITHRIHPQNTHTMAMQHPEWLQAMKSEYDALMTNNTWSLVQLPDDRKAIGCKWVFRLKQNPDGSINKYKARLVAKGFHQKHGFDYTETFSPVVKPVTVRTVLTLAVTNKWSIQQLDINNAFLNGLLDEEVYMVQPPGFEATDKSLVCKLQRALYGLKQAPRAWFERLRSALVKLGFVPIKCDPSLFTLHVKHHTIFLLVYVDDIIITGSSNGLIQQLIHKLNSEFSLKDLGKLDYFLGIEVHHDKSGSLLLSQTKYIRDLLTKANMENANGMASPMASSIKLSKFGSNHVSDPTFFRSIVGGLHYATITRPEISYSVNKVCQFLSFPLEEHWKAVKRIRRYLKGTIHHGLLIKPAPTGAPMALVGFCDADWESNPDDRRSTSGAYIYLGPNLVSWWAKKQTLVARSSAEAEYRSLAQVSAEILWMQSLLKELKIPIKVPQIFCDNPSAVSLAHNPVLHSRTKHMELDIFFVREKVMNKSHYLLQGSYNSETN
ncbi:retrovirus-related Pol polyprotein from transposon TNT 1-94, partial [Trifolium medium]|nr:retrovirus-related Pol polyprotein from transposon TNT 1-94 [Trifolium medium]